MSGTPENPFCKRCGSDNITRDAVVRWDLVAQDWSVSNVFDNATCDDCGNDGDAFRVLEWKPC